jgi:hypothetical protein
MKTPRDQLITALDERMTALRLVHRHPFRRAVESRRALMRWEMPRGGTQEVLPC